MPTYGLYLSTLVHEFIGIYVRKLSNLYYSFLIFLLGGFMSSRTIKLLAPVLVVLVMWFIPAPEGLSQNAWHFLAIFLAVVIGLILEPVPAALVGFTGYFSSSSFRINWKF